MLKDLSSRANSSMVSGIGQGANSIGQVFGILIILPFVNGITLFGDPGRAQALLPAVFLFGLLSLPMLIFYREEGIQINTTEKLQNSNIFSLFKSVFSYKSLAFLFLAYFLFSDSLLTFANNFTLYLDVVFKSSDTIKSVLTAGVLILASVGALIFGKISDKYGNVKILKIIIVCWCVLFFSMSFITNFALALPIFLIAGILFGPIFSITRALVGQLAPDHLVASAYSYYVLAERFATFVGPAIWSGALLIMGEGTRGYQTGIFSLGVLLIISLFALNRVKEPERKIVATI
jgi:UMF1 family MFS transporter